MLEAQRDKLIDIIKGFKGDLGIGDAQIFFGGPREKKDKQVVVRLIGVRPNSTTGGYSLEPRWSVTYTSDESGKWLQHIDVFFDNLPLIASARFADPVITDKKIVNRVVFELEPQTL